MSVGIPVIDEDHKNFITLIHDLNQSITNRMTSDEIKKRLQFIVDDAERHFAIEERLFKEWNYPNTDAHANIHVYALIAIKNIMGDFVPYGHDSGWVNAGLRIRDILMEHIQNEDMKYAEFHRNSNRVVTNEK
jgi:hemerythrin-like metal-binding protein